MGCASSDPRAAAISDITDRTIAFPDYPEPEKTYLSFSQAHGFQVNYIGTGGRAFLWYPGNARAVPEEWYVDQARRAVCWRHPQGSYNPVTRQVGGAFACQDLVFSQKTIVAELPGDVFSLATGAVPYRRGKCEAPAGFDFDERRFSC